ncbi:MAG: hypothetical protein ACTSQS_18325 [Promethearchaeota archaeon]
MGGNVKYCHIDDIRDILREKMDKMIDRFKLIYDVNMSKEYEWIEYEEDEDGEKINYVS